MLALLARSIIRIICPIRRFARCDQSETRYSVDVPFANASVSSSANPTSDFEVPSCNLSGLSLGKSKLQTTMTVVDKNNQRLVCQAALEAASPRALSSEAYSKYGLTNDGDRFMSLADTTGACSLNPVLLNKSGTPYSNT